MKNLIVKINQKEVKIKENQTTLKNVRTIVSYNIERMGVDKKECVITLPNGVKIEYKKLNNVKAFECLLLPSIKLLDSRTEIGAMYNDVLVIIRKKVLNYPLQWDNVGNTNLNYGFDLYNRAVTEALEEELIEEKIANEFIEELNENLDFFKKLDK